MNVNVNLMKENVIRIKSEIMINLDVSVKNLKEHHVCEKYYIGLLMIITCNEITELAKTVPTKTLPTKSTSTNIHILLAFLLITILLLIVFNIYCYLVKYQAKQKHLLPYHVTNNKLKKVLY